MNAFLPNKKSRRQHSLRLTESWIRQHLADTAQLAQPIAAFPFPNLAPLFPETWHDTKVVLTPEIKTPPFTQLGLPRFSELERVPLRSLTYLNTIFIDPGHAHNELLFFRELVHVVQWRAVGAEHFMSAYAAGYCKFGFRYTPLDSLAHDMQTIFEGEDYFPPGLEDHVREKTRQIVAHPLRAPWI
jgi:hypothetical protein